MGTYRWCKLSRHASVIDITVLLLNVYMVFYLGEHVLHVSSVLSTVTFGIYMSKKAPYAMNHNVRHNVHVVFSQVAHITETHIFVLAGLIISDRFILKYDELKELSWPEDGGTTTPRI